MVYLVYIFIFIFIFYMLYLGFLKNGIVLLCIFNCLLWCNWLVILGLWDYRLIFLMFFGMVDGGFCDFLLGVDSSIIV